MHTSKIKLKAISISSLLAMTSLGGCSNVDRSLMFFTATTMGIEVGVDPAQPAPKIIIGYKRAEGVLNPVYLPPEKIADVTTVTQTPQGATKSVITTTQTGAKVAVNDVYRHEAYSVLAKLKGKAGGEATVSKSGEVTANGEVSQWFATGKAADILAANEYAAAALTGSPETAAAIASSMNLGSKLTQSGGFDSGVIATLSTAIHDLNIEIAQNPGGKAAKAIDQLNHEIASDLLGLGTVSFYKMNGAIAQKNGSWVFDPAGSPAFKQWLALQSGLEQAVTVLENLLVKPATSLNTAGNTIYSVAGANVTIDTTVRDNVTAAINEAKAAHASSQQAVNTNPSLVTAIKDVLKVWIELYTGDES